jgi:hypothetical protein
MGGIDAPAPKLSEEELRERLIRIGNTPFPDPHTLWVVEDPRPRAQELDQICYPLGVTHMEMFPFLTKHLVDSHITFYHPNNREDAIADAIHRLAKSGYRCAFCEGVAHPATGCQYSETFLVCGTCIRPYQDFTGKVSKAGLGAYLENWTSAKSSKKLKARFPEAKSFYESAGLFLGHDHRKVRT